MTDYPFDPRWPPAPRRPPQQERHVMPPMTQVAAQFLAWCEDEKASHEKSLAAMRSGELRLHSQTLGQPMRDITQEAIADSERIVAEMTALIRQIKADYGHPGGFQTEIRG